MNRDRTYIIVLTHDEAEDTIAALETMCIQNKGHRKTAGLVAEWEGIVEKIRRELQNG
jgi:hypothetical protein